MKTGIYWQDPKYPAKRMDFIFDPSLVLYLPLHRLDGASLISKDAYGHLCTVTGALWRPNGRYFDGLDDTINCGTGSSLMNINDALTVETWVKLAAVNAYQGIISCGEDAATWVDCPWLLRMLSSNKLCATIDDAAAILSGDTVLTTDIWYHTALTYDKVNLKLFLDAQEDGSTAYTTALTSGVHAVRIGEYRDGNNINALIGEVRIYNRTLTPLEIQRNYLATKWRYR